MAKVVIKNIKNQWLTIDEDDEASWDAPVWAQRLNRHFSFVEFENPVEVDP